MRLKSWMPLGISGATPGYGRHLTSFIIDMESTSFMFDCGEGTQFQLNKYSIKKHKISKIFISHLHGDHYYGLVGLLTTMLLERRQALLYIYAPIGLEAIIRIQMNIPLEEFTYKIVFVNMTRDFQLEEDGVKITTAPLAHGGISTFAYKIEDVGTERNLHKEFIALYGLSIDQILELKKGHDIFMGNQLLKAEELTYIKSKPKSIAICTDTSYLESLVPFVADVDLLYHEATFLEEDRIKATATNHSTTFDAANIAKAAKVKRLIVGHISLRYMDLEKHNEEVSSIFKPSEVATEGQIYLL